MREIDPRIEDGDLDVLTVQTGRTLPHARRADERHTLRVVDVIGRDRLDRHDARQRRQATDLIRRGTDLDAVDCVLECPEHLGTRGLGSCNDRPLLGAQVGFDRVSIGLGDLLAGHPATHHRHWIARQLQDDDALALLSQSNGGCQPADRRRRYQATVALGRLCG